MIIERTLALYQVTLQPYGTASRVQCCWFINLIIEVRGDLAITNFDALFREQVGG